MSESFECGACARRVHRLEGSGIAVTGGARRRLCPACKRQAGLARTAEVAERRRVGRIVNALRERERHEREGAIP